MYFIQQLINGLAIGSIYALIALGYTMVYGVLRFINFAHGEVFMVGAMASFYLAKYVPVLGEPSLLHLIIVLLFAMMVSALLGVLIEFLAYKPLRNSSKITTLITAIGVSFFLQYGGQLLMGSDPKVFPNLIESKALFSSSHSSLTLNSTQVLTFLVSLILMIFLHLFVQKSKTGKAMRAISFSPLAAKFTGIPVNRIVTLTFFMGSALAGAAAVLVSLDKTADPLMGLMPGLKAFVAAVLGGIGSLPGAMLGGLLMGLSETMLVAYAPQYSTYRDALAFIFLIAILLIKPQGLLGQTKIEKV